MNPHPRSPTLGERPSAPSRGMAMLMWFAAIIVAAALLWMILVLTGAAEAVTSLKIVAWVVIVLSLGVSSLAKRQQKRRYRRRFPDLDDLRRHVDVDVLRAVRDQKGEAQAVRKLRREVPEVPLADAVQLVKGL